MNRLAIFHKKNVTLITYCRDQISIENGLKLILLDKQKHMFRIKWNFVAIRNVCHVLKFTVFHAQSFYVNCKPLIVIVSDSTCILIIDG